MNTKNIKTTFYSTSIALIFVLTSPVQAQILVSNNFNAPGTPSNFFWSGGNFTNAAFNEAWNLNSSGQQIFTTSFTPTSLSVGDILRTTFQYNAFSNNISSIRVGLFSGTAASANTWAQFNSSVFSSGWTGYTGVLAINSGNSVANMKTNINSNPFFGATNGSNSVAQSFANGSLNAGGLTLERTANGMVVTLSQGANLASLTPIVSYTNNTSAITNFNIFALYNASGAQNDVRYDTVRVEYQAIPEPNTYALMLLGGIFAFVMVRRMRGRSRSTAR
jgi:hypothetical protein